MDVLAHGLWGGMIAGWRKKFGLAFLFGVTPDVLAFGLWIAVRVIHGNWPRGKPHIDSIPDWVHTSYAVTHSLIIVGLIWAFLWWRRKDLAVPFSAWIIHILFDIPSHSKDFFPTPFLYPLSDFEVSGISWGQRWFIILNYSCLLGLAILWIRARNRRETANRLKKSQLPQEDRSPLSRLFSKRST